MCVCVWVSVSICVHMWIEKLSKRKNIYYTDKSNISGTTRREKTGDECSGGVVRDWVGLGWQWLVIMVTGSGSTAVCCPFARPWWAARWCPPRYSLETRHGLIDQQSASVIRCDRSLQDRAEALNIIMLNIEFMWLSTGTYAFGGSSQWVTVVLAAVEKKRRFKST